MAGGKVLLSEGQFSISSQILAETSGITLAGCGPSTILKAASDLPITEAVVRFGEVLEDRENGEIRDLTIDGNAGEVVAALVFGLSLTGNSYTRFRAVNLFIHDVKGTAVLAGTDMFDSLFRDIVIHTTTLKGHDGPGAGSGHNTLERVWVEDTAQEGIFLAHCHDTRVICCSVKNTTANPGIHFHGEHADARDNIVMGCIVQGAGQHGIDIAGGSPVYPRMVIVGNKVSGCAFDGIHLAGVDNSIIQGNICWDNGQTAGDGIALVDCDENIVAGNRCYATQLWGIQEEGTSDWNLFHGNNLRGNVTGGLSTVGGNSVSADNL